LNAVEATTLGLPDVQAGEDRRGVRIDEVGIEGLPYPVAVEGRGGERQRTVADVAMSVSLAEDRRGVHMSRFVELLDIYAPGVSRAGFEDLTESVRMRLDATDSRVEMAFPYFLRRAAPASGSTSMNRYECRLVGRAGGGRPVDVEVGVRVPITSLCPCSKEISDYGAHNQRGHVEIAAEGAGLWFEDLIEVAERGGSAPILALLKRVDERVVTMQAYDNPAFVEDIVRDVLVALRGDRRIKCARVGVSNEESIHAHNAVARLRWERADG
jgi:GTP cyclohydrolase FolE2